MNSLNKSGKQRGHQDELINSDGESKVTQINNINAYMEDTEQQFGGLILPGEPSAHYGKVVRVEDYDIYDE